MLFNRRKSLPQVSQDLLAMADYIREHGWCQGTIRTNTGQVCLVGALCLAISNDLPRHQAVFNKLNIPHWGKWNDAPGRTVEEVLDLLERLAWEAAP